MIAGDFCLPFFHKVVLFSCTTSKNFNTYMSNTYDISPKGINDTLKGAMMWYEKGLYVIWLNRSSTDIQYPLTVGDTSIITHESVHLAQHLLINKMGMNLDESTKELFAGVVQYSYERIDDIIRTHVRAI